MPLVAGEAGRSGVGGAGEGTGCKCENIHAGINTRLSTASSGEGGGSDMFQYFSTILYVHYGNSREGKSTLWVGSPCAPHTLNKSLVHLEQLKVVQFSIAVSIGYSSNRFQSSRV